MLQPRVCTEQAQLIPHVTAGTRGVTPEHDAAHGTPGRDAERGTSGFTFALEHPADAVVHPDAGAEDDDDDGERDTEFGEREARKS